MKSNRRRFFSVIAAAVGGAAIPKAAMAKLPDCSAAWRAGYYRDKFKLGLMSVNEVRKLENLNPLPAALKVAKVEVR